MIEIDEGKNVVKIVHGPEEAVYDVASLSWEAIERIGRGDVPLPEKGAIAWHPIELWGAPLPPDARSVIPGIVRWREGVLNVGNAPRLLTWVTERVLEIWGVQFCSPQWTGKSLILETEHGTFEVREHKGLVGVGFYDPNRRQFVRLWADNAEKLIDYLEETKRTGRYNMRTGVIVEFL